MRADPRVLLELHASQPQRYPALFESTAGTGEFGRFDILFAHPQHEIRLNAQRQLEGASGSGFLSALDTEWSSQRVGRVASSLPFHGGWLVYLGYELAGEIEPRLTLPRDTVAIARAVRIPAAVICDRRSSTITVIAEASYAHLVEAICTDIAHVRTAQDNQPSAFVEAIEENPPEHYVMAVKRALEFIAAGDIYQANLSRGWHARLKPHTSAADVYRKLRVANPGPFNAVAQFDDLSVISSSPERLVSVRDGVIATRPIAGTRPRSRDVQADADLARELRAHPKEQAEHVMLIDLERNDLGRVCEPGTVEVDEYMSIESYAHVHHIVSNVRGRLRADVTPGRALAATFPGGTITGCPKVRCMQIIGELEGVSRSAYTGSLGYLNRDGSMDFNILIRSLEMRDRQLTFRAGGGIVADSIPERELAESRAKALGMLRALGASEVVP